MWAFPTSVVVPSRRWIVILVVVALVMGAVGFALGFGYRAGTLPGSNSATNPTLSLVAAGTLDRIFPQIANALVNETPGTSAPAAAQVYEGSIVALDSISQLHTKVDVGASADFRLIPQLLKPTYASYEVVFGTTPEVLAYNPNLAAFHGINATNWGWKIQASGITLGVANASTDPNGYNEIFSLELQGLLYNGSLAAVYSHFFNGPPGTYAIANGVTAKVFPETQAASLLASGEVSAFIIYQSYAISHGLTYASFSPQVGLGNTSAADVSFYALASTTIPTPGGGESEVVKGAPVLFSATVPLNAPNPSLGAAFIHLLLSPQGSTILSRGGAFTPIFPGWVDAPGAVPSVLAPDVVPMPGSLSALLA